MSSSSDEGEIRENGVEDSKASTLPLSDGNGVDRQDRRAKATRSPDRGDYRSRRNRSPRGHKRSRDDDRDRDPYSRGGRGGSDPRRFRVRYEDTTSSHARHTYDDPDRPANRGRYDDVDRPSSHRYNGSRDHTYTSSRYDDRDRDHNRVDKRPRAQSPPPQRASGGTGKGRHDRNNRNVDGHGRFQPGQQVESIKYSSQTARSARDDAASRRNPAAESRDSFKKVAKFDQGATDERMAENTSHLHLQYVPPCYLPGMTADMRYSDNQHSPMESNQEPEQDLEAPQSLDEEAEIERRRRRREALLRKSRASTPLLVQAVQANMHDPTTETPPEVDSPHRTPRTPGSGKHCRLTHVEHNANWSDVASPAGRGHGSESPEALDITNDRDLINTHGEVKADEEDGPSAADYDPTVDMREDERRDEMRNGIVGLHGEDQREAKTFAPEDKNEPMTTTEADKQDDDNDDEFDMFAEDFDEQKFVAPKATPQAKAPTEDPVALQRVKGGAILEDDDKDGYYKIRPSEIINGRYQIQSSLGKGMFSGVARAVDITTKKLVAIKIMRNNDALKKGGFTEIAILQKLNSADPDNKKHIVKFERSFDHKGHLCMAFENLSLNLREVLKKFGNNVGINLLATKAYAHQIFLALAHMRKCSIIHADLKPDNILVSLFFIFFWSRNWENDNADLVTGQRTAQHPQDL